MVILAPRVLVASAARGKHMMFSTNKETKTDEKQPRPPRITPIVPDFFYHDMIYAPTKEEMQQGEEDRQRVQREIKARKEKEDDIRHHAWE
jgi:hypothetical protein